MNREELQDLITHNLEDIAKIAVSLSTQIEKSNETVGYLQFLMLQYAESFARIAKHEGTPNLSIRENLERRGIKNPNLEYDVNAVVQSYAQSQINSPNYRYNGETIFNKKIEKDIYMPTSIEKPHLQIPLVNLARLSIADGGLSSVENKRLALQSGFSKLSDRGQELFDLIVKTAQKEEFVAAYAKAYLDRFCLEGGVNRSGDEYSYSLYTPYVRGSWNNSIGDFDEDGGEHVLTCKI